MMDFFKKSSVALSRYVELTSDGAWSAPYPLASGLWQSAQYRENTDAPF